MKRKLFQSNDIKLAVIGMVTDPIVLSRIASHWERGGLFPVKWANLVGNWCVDHLDKYGEPPNKKMVDIFENWACKTTANEDTVDLVEKFLIELSAYQEKEGEVASDYLMDAAGRALNNWRLKETLELVEEDRTRGKLDEAWGKISTLSRVELGNGGIIKPGEDWDVWKQAWDKTRRKPLIEYPGALGILLGDSLARDSLIALQAPDKAGKTFFLMDMAVRAMREGHRVIYFDVGDMSQDDIILRLGQRVAMKPLNGNSYNRPVGFDDEKKPIIKEVKTEPLTAGQAYKTFRKLSRKRDLLRISCHPNSSINVAGIVSLIREWEREDWVPSIIVLDYADILAPPNGIRETLDQIDYTWKSLRRLSQELHCLVITASQSNAAAYKNDDKALLSRKNFSGRKTKLAHVNGMLGLNVSPADKALGITRVNWVVRRGGAFSETTCAIVAGCLDIGCPVMKSTF